MGSTTGNDFELSMAFEKIMLGFIIEVLYFLSKMNNNKDQLIYD